jgi:hypothetical protein
MKWNLLQGGLKHAVGANKVSPCTVTIWKCKIKRIITRVVLQYTEGCQGGE